MPFTACCVVAAIEVGYRHLDLRQDSVPCAYRQNSTAWEWSPQKKPLFERGQATSECRAIFCGLPGGYSPREIADVEDNSGRNERTLACYIPDCQCANRTNPCFCDPERLSATERNNLTDMRTDLVKAALQLTPDQEKLWPPVESAIRARAEDRKARLAKIGEGVGRRAEESRAEVMRNCDPVAFLQRRSEALAQRSADFDKLAKARQPLLQNVYSRTEAAHDGACDLCTSRHK